MNQQMEEYREKIASQEREMNSIIAELENQKQLTNKSPSVAVKTMVEKLKQQLAQKEQQQNFLNQALLDLKSDMLGLAKTNLISAANDENYDRKMQNIIEKTSGEYQDKLFSLTEELNKIKKELKAKISANQEITLELENLKAQSSTVIFICYAIS
jgi:centrosomal protein CEP290